MSFSSFYSGRNFCWFFKTVPCIASYWSVSWASTQISVCQTYEWTSLGVLKTVLQCFKINHFYISTLIAQLNWNLCKRMKSTRKMSIKIQHNPDRAPSTYTHHTGLCSSFYSMSNLFWKKIFLISGNKSVVMYGNLKL